MISSTTREERSIRSSVYLKNGGHRPHQFNFFTAKKVVCFFVGFWCVCVFLEAIKENFLLVLVLSLSLDLLRAIKLPILLGGESALHEDLTEEGLREDDGRSGIDPRSKLGGNRRLCDGAHGPDSPKKSLSAIALILGKNGGDHTAIDEDNISGTHAGLDILVGVLDADTACDGKNACRTVHESDIIAEGSCGLGADGECTTMNNDAGLEECEILFCRLPTGMNSTEISPTEGFATDLRGGSAGSLLVSGVVLWHGKGCDQLLSSAKGQSRLLAGSFLSTFFSEDPRQGTKNNKQPNKTLIQLHLDRGLGLGLGLGLDRGLDL